MPTSTTNLSLYKYDTTTDGDLTFNFNDSLNDNWDKIDTAYKGLSDDKADASTVNSALALKADASTVNSALALKADTSTVNSALALKADKTTLHALKAYSDKGELLTDAEGLANVTNYAHSTFDLSKFTVVGSPTITDDGVASGFSVDDNINLPTFNVNGKNFEVDLGKITTTNDVTTSQYITGSTTTTTGVFSLLIQSGRLYIASYNVYFSTKDCMAVTANTDYYIKYGVNGSNAYIKVSTDGEHYTEYTSAITTAYTNLTIKLGTAANAYPFQGSIDLKQFSITVGGVSVFSGNKTGIDTIKPNDYTVVGTPTISEDGVASGFSENNYLTSNVTLNGTILQFEQEFETGTSVAGNQDIIRSDNFVFLIGTSNNKQVIRVRWGANDSGWNASAYELQPSTKYKFIGTFNTVTGEVVNKLHSSTGSLLDTTTATKSSYEVSTSAFVAKIGSLGSTTDRYFTGKIDLNTTKFYSNGNLVYQPCLKIPYTQSKTGSKIVNAVYRDRVKDMAEQFGSANYYTLDEANGNFTLPQGEIYGLFQRKTSWIYADQTNAISTATALGTYDLTSAVTSVLPVDSDNYECLFRYGISRKQAGGSTNTNYTVTVSSNIVLKEAIDSAATSGGADTNDHCGQFTAIIDKTRAMSLEIGSQALNSSDLYLVAYRKVN